MVMSERCGEFLPLAKLKFIASLSRGNVAPSSVLAIPWGMAENFSPSIAGDAVTSLFVTGRVGMIRSCTSASP
jgi:hypothetical protein